MALIDLEGDTPGNLIDLDEPEDEGLLSKAKGFLSSVKRPAEAPAAVTNPDGSVTEETPYGPYTSDPAIRTPKPAYSDPEVARLKARQDSALASRDRSAAEIATDTARALGSGLASAVGMPLDLLAPGSDVARRVRGQADIIRENYSPQVRARQDLARQATAQAEDEGGQWGAFKTSLSETLSDPSLAATVIAEQLPNAAVAVLASAFGGLKAAGWVNALLSGGDARGSAYDAMIQIGEKDWAKDPEYLALREGGMSHTDAASERASSMSKLAGGIGATVGFVTGRTGLEAAVAKKTTEELIDLASRSAIAKGVKSGLVELGGEQLEELAPLIASNVQVQGLDNRSALKGAGETAAQTLVGTGPFAGAAGGMAAAEVVTAKRESAERALADLDAAQTVPEMTEAATRAVLSVSVGDNTAGLLAQAQAAAPTASLPDAIADVEAATGALHTGIPLPEAPGATTAIDDSTTAIDDSTTAIDDSTTAFPDSTTAIDDSTTAIAAAPQVGRGRAGYDFNVAVGNEVEQQALAQEAQSRKPAGAPAEITLPEAAPTAERPAFEGARTDVVLRSIEQRGGVATQEEADWLEAAGAGKPYDSILSAAAPAPQVPSAVTPVQVNQARQQAEARTAQVEQEETQALDYTTMPQQRVEMAAKAGSKKAKVELDRRLMPAPRDNTAAGAPLQQVQDEEAQLSPTRPGTIAGQAADSYTTEQLTELSRSATGATRNAISHELIRRGAVNPAGLSTASVPTAEETAALEGTQAPAAESTPAPKPADGSSARTPGVATEAVTQGTDEVSSRIRSVISRSLPAGTPVSATVVDPNQHPGRVSKVEAAVTKAIAGVFKKKIVWFRGSWTDAKGQSHFSGLGGFVHTEGDTTFINIEGPQSALTLFMHEVTHLMQRDFPSVYAVIKAKVRADIEADPKKFKAFRQYYGMALDAAEAAEFKAADKKAGRGAREYLAGDIEAVLDEAVADAMGNQAQSAKFWSNVFTRIAMKEGKAEARGIVTRLRDAMVRMITATVAQLQGRPGFANFITDLEGISEALEEAAASYIVGQRDNARAVEGEDVQVSASRTGESSEEVVARINARLTNGKVTLLADADPIPKSVQDTLNREGLTPQDLKGIITPGGDVFVFKDRHASASEVERTVLHEMYGHFGLRALMGKEVYRKLSNLYAAVGPQRVLELAEKYGVDLAFYRRSVIQGAGGASPAIKARAGGEIALRQSLLADELLAQIAERETGKIQQLAKEVIGAIRQWLRAHGFAALAEYGETDLAYLLGQARRAAETGKAEEALPGFSQASNERSTLNVGLDVAGGARLTEQEVRDAIEATGAKIAGITLHQSDSEMTAVVELEKAMPKATLHQLSIDLKQQAIAQRFADGTGELAGPEAAAWGDYTPDFFLMKDGSRASDPKWATKQSTERPDAVSTVAYHFSKQKRDTVTSGHYGTGMRAAEASRLSDRTRQRTAWYVNTGKGIFPEDGVGSHAHRATLANLYDKDADAKGFAQENRKDLNAFEEAVMDAGYDGYVTREFGPQGAAVLLGVRATSPEYVGVRQQISPKEAGEALPAPKLTGQQSLLRAFVAKQGAYPGGMLTGEEWGRLVEKLDPEVFAALEPTGVFGSAEKMFKDDLVRASKLQLSTERLNNAQRNNLLAGWMALAQNDRAFTYPVSDSTDFMTIMKTVAPKNAAKDVSHMYLTKSKRDAGHQQFHIDMAGTDAFVKIDPTDKTVHVNLASLKEGSGGAAVYAAVGNWAHNNGYVFIGDPEDISVAGIKRRLENMISSALKFGTTNHIRPHVKQLDWLRDEAGVDIEWHEGDSIRNIKYMLEASYLVNAKLYPEIENVEFRNGIFLDRKTGRPADLEAIAESARGDWASSRGVGAAGIRTLKRGIISGALVRGEDSGVGGSLLEGLVSGTVEPVGELEGVLYSPERARAVTETPEFKKWFGDSKVVDAEGKPLVVYHGTSATFTEFEEGRANGWSVPRGGFYFTDERSAAEEFGKPIPAYLSAQNPLDLRDTSANSPAFWKAYDNLPAEQQAEIDDLPMSSKPYGAVVNGLVQTKEFISAAKEAGFDGLVFHDRLGAGPSFEAFVVFRPAQIKSATGNSGAFDPNNPDIRYSPSRQLDTFYSQLEQAVADAPAKVFTTGKMVGAWLQSNSAKLGVKKDEIQWSGITDWLATQGKVTKEDVLAYLEHGGVKIEEVVLGVTETPLTARPASDFSPKELKKFPGYEGIEPTDWLIFLGEDWRGTYQGGADTEAEAVAAYRQEAQDEGYQGVLTGGETKHSKWQLPGGENYRELLLTLPVSGSGGKRVRVFTSDGLSAVQVMTDEQIDKMRESGRRRFEVLDTVNPKGTFASSHFDQPNILAHVRFNERQDADGKRVLFIEEVQSDWGQQGKKVGFADPNSPVYSVFAKPGAFLKSFEKKADADAFAESVDGVVREEKRQPGDDSRPPSAPFVTDTKAWTALALKRMIAYAAANGFDKIAFITGEQSADRYDLSKQVESINYQKTGDQYRVMAVAIGGDVAFDDVVSEGGLEEVVGKEVAQKIIDGEGALRRGTLWPAQTGGYKKLSGLDLKVGGEGMKAFYDAIVPQVANDVLRKIGGGKVGTVEIDTRTPESNAYYEDLTDADILKQPGFDITDKMREKVKTEGLPLFSTERASQHRFPGNPNSAFSAPIASRLDDLIYVLQDKHIDMKRVFAEINTAADKWNAYLQEELFHGRSAKRTADFISSELKPLFTDMKARGVDMSDFEEYLWNRHAEERNAQIAAINPNMPDGGSGIDTADAQSYLAGLPPARLRAFEALAKRIDAITEGTRQMLVDYGLEKASTIAAWESTYQHYVPLQREDMDIGQKGAGTGAGFSIRGSASKRAMGSGKPVVDIMAHLALQRERVIIRGEKNRVGMALYGAAIQNPNQDFWAPINPSTNPTDIERTLIALGINPIDAKNAALAPIERYVDPRTGLVAERASAAYRNAPNVVALRVDGEDRYVVFNQADPRAERMAESLKNLDADSVGQWLGTVAKATRYFASINTQYNPIFGVVNLIRDTQGALLNLSSTVLKNDRKAVMGHVPSALAGIYSDLRAVRKNRAPTSQWAALWEEFQNEGGATGFKDMFANAEERADKLRDELAQISEGKLKAAGRSVFSWLSDYNTTMENAVRLAAYKVAKEKGISNAQAASLAKNLTVNFNRKGQIGRQAGALYAFFNANVQGTARLAETLFEFKGGKPDWSNIRLSPFGKKVMVGGILLGSMQALLLAAAGFDDGDPPDFIRERNLILPIGDKKYLTLPMPLGFHVIPNLGRIPTEFVLGGFKNAPKHVGRLIGLFFDTFNPMGSAGLSMQTIAWTVLDPFAALVENKDWAGKPIAKLDRSSLDPTPGFTRAKDTASLFGRWISHGLNTITGGDTERQGLLSPTPDQIDYLIGQATGGVGRELMKLQQTTSAAVTGEELPPYKIPLAGRFYGNARSQASEGSAFYSNVTKLNVHERVMKGRASRGESVSEYRKANPDAALVEAGNQTERRVQEYRKLKRQMVERGASKEQIRAIEAAITRTMAGLNEAVRKAEQQAQ